MRMNWMKWKFCGRQLCSVPSFSIQSIHPLWAMNFPQKHLQSTLNSRTESEGVSEREGKACSIRFLSVAVPRQNENELWNELNYKNDYWWWEEKQKLVLMLWWGGGGNGTWANSHCVDQLNRKTRIPLNNLKAHAKISNLWIFKFKFLLLPCLVENHAKTRVWRQNGSSSDDKKFSVF